MSSPTFALHGEQTLVACWQALARLSPGAHLVRVSGAVAAVFPTWTPLNNTIATDRRQGAPARAVTRLRSLYADAGIPVWALWLPSRATDFDTPDDVSTLDGMQRDTTTLVMHAEISSSPRRHDGIVRASMAAVTRFARDEPVPV